MLYLPYTTHIQRALGEGGGMVLMNEWVIPYLMRAACAGIPMEGTYLCNVTDLLPTSQLSF